MFDGVDMNNQQKSIVKASFYASPSVRETEFLANSACYLLISVGQKYHEGEKLAATIDLVSRRFEQCTILVADTLQRYNQDEFFRGDYETACRNSLRYGDEWLARNEPIYSKLSIPYKISRWDEWINTASYFRSRAEFENIYEKNAALRNSLNESIDEFITRLKKRATKKEEDYFSMRYAYCLSYLKEECTTMLLWARAGLGYEIYPTKRNAAMSTTYELLIKPHYPLQLAQLALRFKRYQQNQNMAIKVYLKEPILESVAV